MSNTLSIASMFSTKMHVILTFGFTLTLMASCLLCSQAIDCQINPKEPLRVAYTLTVSNSGPANFSKVQHAVNSIPSYNDKWIRILLSPGTYTEKLLIPENATCIVLEGHGLDNTVIQFNDHAQQSVSPADVDQSASVTILAENFIPKGITFKNTFDTQIAHNKSLNEVSAEYSIQMKIAVATEICGDKVAFYNCGFVGVQDTLYDAQGRHYFKTCYIEGSVDFIFGNGQSVYEDCFIHSTRPGYITAQGRDAINQSTGFLFKGVTIYGSGPTYLGRAWRAYSRVVFRRSKFADIIAPKGWNAWGYAGHESKFTYVEYKCGGRGANTKGRVPWLRVNLSPYELKIYTVNGFINQDGWIQKQPLN